MRDTLEVWTVLSEHEEAGLLKGTPAEANQRETLSLQALTPLDP